MSLINFKSVVSSSSEDRVHCSKNLLRPEENKKWLSAKGSEEHLTCVLQLDQSSSISSIEIGNAGSAFIELLVFKDNDWTLLLPVSPLMTPKESKSNTNRNQIKTFQSSDLNASALNEKWKRVKIICEQKFNRSKPYGLAFIKLYSSSKEVDVSGSRKRSLTTMDATDEDESDETGEEQSKIGSLFAKKQAEKKFKTDESTSIDRSSTSSNVASELLRRKSRPESESVERKPTTDASPHCDQDKSTLMKNVVFVLSGFQNPLRSELRTKATSMGATFSDDWNDKCTHLFCAFANTPKFTQVQQSGHGAIVSQQWILDSYDQNRLLAEKSYALTANDEPNKTKDTPGKKKASTSEMPPSAEKPKTPVKKKSIKSENSEKEKQGDLPDFFHDMHFYVSYGDFDDKTLTDIIRVILAYDGVVEKQIDANVKYMITKRMWNADFEKISKTHPEIQFVGLDWLQDCHDASAFASIESHLIAP